MCFSTTEQERRTWVGTESISLTHRGQSAKEILTCWLMMTEQVSRLDFGGGEGDFILKITPLSLTPLYPRTHNQNKSRHQDMCVQGSLRIPHSDTGCKGHGSVVLILAASMAGDLALLWDVLFEPWSGQQLASFVSPSHPTSVGHQG